MVAHAATYGSPAVFASCNCLELTKDPWLSVPSLTRGLLLNISSEFKQGSFALNWYFVNVQNVLGKTC